MSQENPIDQNTFIADPDASAVGQTEKKVEFDQINNTEIEAPLKSSNTLVKETDNEILLIPNKFKLHLYAATLGIGSFQTGWVLCGNTQTAPILVMQFGWNEEEAKLYNTLINSAAIAGLFVGTFIGGPIIAHGRRKSYFWMETICIIGALITEIFNIWPICIGRFVHGIGAGVMNVAMAKSLYETVPQSMSG
jgi:predicted MFS family arabinose efflux permease